MFVTRLRARAFHQYSIRLAHTVPARARQMGKKGRGPVAEEFLHLPPHPSASASSASVCDTHTHLLSTFAQYTMKYSPSSAYPTVHEFVRGVYCSDTPPPFIDGRGMMESSTCRGDQLVADDIAALQPLSSQVLGIRLVL